MRSLLLAAALASSPASAQAQAPGFEADDYFAAFAHVCLQNFGNPEKQVQTAKGLGQATKKSMWKPESQQFYGTRTRLTFLGAAVDVDPGNRKSCSVSMRVDQAISLETLGAGISGIMGGIRPTMKGDESVWILKVGGENSPPLLLAASTSSVAAEHSVQLKVQESGL